MISIKHPISVLLDFPELIHMTPEEIFSLTNHLDEYEIAKDLENEIIVDVLEVSATGSIRLYLTFCKPMSYEDIHKEIQSIINHAQSRTGLSLFRYELKKLNIHIEMKGVPSWSCE